MPPLSRGESLSRRYRVGERVLAVLLYRLPDEKRIGLSLLSHLVHLAPFRPPKSLREGTQLCATVCQILRTKALLLCALPALHSESVGGDVAAEPADSDGMVGCGIGLVGAVLRMQDVAADALDKLRMGSQLEVVVTPHSPPPMRHGRGPSEGGTWPLHGRVSGWGSVSRLRVSMYHVCPR